MNFSVTAQQYGAYFAGFSWTLFGCGTYRTKVGRAQAEGSFRVYFDRLQRSIGSPIAGIGVLESRPSGLGHSPIPLHWHFVIAAPVQCTAGLLRNSSEIWSKRYGDSQVDLYNPQRSGAYYLAKLADHANFEYHLHNIQRMTYAGPMDLFEAFQTDPYVPVHVRDKTSGTTLVLR